jgi:predicted SnoaL-like aldol condensation-catalyzing enzyme
MMNADNEALVLAYYDQLYSSSYAKAIAFFLTANYIEHQYTAGFSKAGLADYVQSRLDKNPKHRIIIYKVISDGDFVFLFVEEKIGDGVDVARAELFRVQGSKVTEHWGSHVADEKNRKNSNGTFDGPQPNRRVDYAMTYVERFEELDRRGFAQQELECFYESRVPEYKQHSPKGGDGLAGLVDILQKMKNAGIKMLMEPKRVLVDGDFIVCHRLYDTSPPHPLVNRINTFDLFRLNEDGKAVEHWDVMEDIPSADMLSKVF